MKILKKGYLYSLTTQLENLLKGGPYNDTERDNIVMDLLERTKGMKWNILNYWHDKFVKTKKLPIDKIYQKLYDNHEIFDEDEPLLKAFCKSEMNNNLPNLSSYNYY